MDTDNALAARRVEGLDGFNIESFGAGFARYGLALVIIWIGFMKFTAYETTGITPLVSHSPLMAWLLDFMSMRTISAGLGVIEVTTALLIASRRFSVRAAQTGGLMAICTFLITLSFMLSTPGAWAPQLGGFPAPSGGALGPGQFLLKDIINLGVSIWVFGEATNALKQQRRSTNRTVLTQERRHPAITKTRMRYGWRLPA